MLFQTARLPSCQTRHADVDHDIWHFNACLLLMCMIQPECREGWNTHWLDEREIWTYMDMRWNEMPDGWMTLRRFGASAMGMGGWSFDRATGPGGAHGGWSLVTCSRSYATDQSHCRLHKGAWHVWDTLVCTEWSSTSRVVCCAAACPASGLQTRMSGAASFNEASRNRRILGSSVGVTVCAVICFPALEKVANQVAMHRIGIGTGLHNRRLTPRHRSRSQSRRHRRGSC
jgi:hypothetical protein